MRHCYFQALLVGLEVGLRLFIYDIRVTLLPSPPWLLFFFFYVRTCIYYH